MAFAELTQAWGRNGEASVLLGALRDAGFDPIIECDPLGWMYFYGWPLGSSRPITIWIDENQRDEAMAFLAAGCETPLDAIPDSDTLAGLVRTHRRWLYLAWLLEIGPFAALLVGAWASVHKPQKKKRA